jgi:hypothetical protein
MHQPALIGNVLAESRRKLQWEAGIRLLVRRLWHHFARHFYAIDRRAAFGWAMIGSMRTGRTLAKASRRLEKLKEQV